MPSLGSYLKPLTGSIGNLKDYKHASRLYADNVFSLAPKAGWLYYVSFDINPSAITDATWANQQRVTEVGMLVKSVDLPKFAVQTEVVNQYNKKSVIQKSITYSPVSFAIHDDQTNVVHNLWVNYYRYYFADSKYRGTGPIGTARDNTAGAYSKSTQYNPPTGLFTPTNFGLNSDLVIEPFFRSVTIYQLNRKLFTSFQLINPIISSWDHDRMDQNAENKLTENKMTVNYEAVFYGSGQVRKDDPTGFAMFHYDNSPSPLSIAGGGNSTIFGPGGIIPGALEIFGDVNALTNPGARRSPLDLLGTVIKGANLVRNVKGINKDSLRQAGQQILSGAVGSVLGSGQTGLGIGLNMVRSEYARSGQFLGTPISAVNSAAAQSDIVGQNMQYINGLPPVSAEPPASNPSKGFGQDAAKISETTEGKLTQFGAKDNTDSTPSGNTPAAGSYFTPQETPQINLGPYQESKYVSDSGTTTAFNTTNGEEDTVSGKTTSYSDPAPSQRAIDNLNTAWAQDRESLQKTNINTNDVVQRVAQARSPEEAAAIKSEAQSRYASQESLSNQIDEKYNNEYNRLVAANDQTRSVQGNTNLQTTPDPTPASVQPSQVYGIDNLGRPDPNPLPRGVTQDPNTGFYIYKGERFSGDDRAVLQGKVNAIDTNTPYTYEATDPTTGLRRTVTFKPGK